MGHAIFNTHQTRGTCTGMCACNRMHQMEKIAQADLFDYICEQEGVRKHAFMY